MSYKSILVPFAGGAGSEAALGTAITLGAGFGARLELLHVEIDPVVALAGMGEGMAAATAGMMIESAQAAARARAESAHGLADAQCRGAGWTLLEAGRETAGDNIAIWRQVVGRENEAVARRGHVSDLIVVATPDKDEGSAISGLAAGALFDSGRPVLVTPVKAPYVIGNKVALAWNASREAARAVAAAMPFIAAAEQVTVIADPPPDGGPAAADLVAYLSLHGVAATTVDLPSDNRVLGERLVYAAVTAGADLLVMGAYGHSRLRELVLGGATLGALQHTTIPLLMAH